MFECNALITGARITKEEHGLLSAWLTLDYGGSGQGFGGYALYLPKDFKNQSAGPHCGLFIWRCLEVADVESWDQLKGKTVRVRKQDEWGAVEAIGHILKDDWFYPSKEFDELK